MKLRRVCADVGDDVENWVNVPTNSILTIHNQTVMVHPIIDQFYDRSPYHIRSSAFVQAKGLAANEKAAALMTPSVGGNMGSPDLQKRVLAPTIPFGVPLGRATDPNVTAPAKGRPQSGLQELLVTSPDARSITTLSSGQSSASRQPVRRNIKVKRKSLGSPDQITNANRATDQQPAADDSDTDSPEQHGHGIGHPHKLSRFFPELTMN